MSAALLKLSLQLVEEDLSETKNKKKTKEKPKKDEIPLKQKPNIQEIRKRKKESANKAQENLAKLLKLSSTSNPIDKITADKLIQRARTGRYVIPEQKPKEEEKSIFTEEDFQKFEREYFCS